MIALHDLLLDTHAMAPRRCAVDGAVMLDRAAFRARVLAMAATLRAQAAQFATHCVSTTRSTSPARCSRSSRAARIRSFLPMQLARLSRRSCRCLDALHHRRRPA